MKLEAKTRLQSSYQQEIASVDYSDYCRVIACLDPSVVLSFDFKIPGPLKKLWDEIKQVGTYLKEAGEVGYEHLVKAFQEKSVFHLLKGFAFSLGKLLKAVIAALRLPSSALFAALDMLVDVFKNKKLLTSLKPAERLSKLQEVIKQHPVLTKVTGLAVAGLLFVIFLKSSMTGNVGYDLGIVDSIVAAARGDFDLVTLFASKDGLHILTTLLFGVVTGTGITDYGLAHVESLLTFLGAHSGEIYSILLALFYAGAKRAKLHFAGKVPKEITSARSQEWFHKMHPTLKNNYTKKYPGTKFVDKTKVILPC